jgi:hypothetical protein
MWYVRPSESPVAKALGGADVSHRISLSSNPENTYRNSLVFRYRSNELEFDESPDLARPYLYR